MKIASIINGTSMQTVVPNNYANIEEKYGLPIYSVHRVDLHDQLKALAISGDGPGLPCKLQVRAEVVDYVSYTLTSSHSSYSFNRF